MTERRDQPEWFVVGPNRKLFGPYSIATLARYAADGRLAPSQLVCKLGMREWAEARTLPELEGYFRTKRDGDDPQDSEGLNPPDSRMPRFTPAWVVGKAVDQSRASLSVRLMMAVDDLSGYAIVAGGLLAVSAAAFLLITTALDGGGARSIMAYAALIASVGVTQYVGLRLSAVCGRTISRSTVTISNSAILDIMGVAFVVSFLVVIVTAGVMAYEGRSPRVLIFCAVACSPSIVGAVFAFNPQIIGIRISEAGSLGEDSVALLGLPNRVCMASAGIVSGTTSIVGGAVSLIGLAAMTRLEILASVDLSTNLTPTELTLVGITIVACSGLWPLLTYLWCALDHLWLGTLEAIHAVSRQTRHPNTQSEDHGSDE
jgi:hypothetical protein